MRTIPFRSVYEGVARQIGLSPDSTEIVVDTRRTIVEHINKRVRMAWRYWEWPELEVTEERAFRPIWNASRVFHRIDANGKPDEFFYIPTMSYYRVLPADTIDADPPPGTLPTNTAYFEPISPMDAYVSLDEVCQYPIGTVYGIYASNPRLNGCCYHAGLRYRPSEKGIDVCGSAGPTVFVKYQILPSKFTLEPRKDGLNYRQNDVVYDGVTGECFRALADNINKPLSDVDTWVKVLFPEILAEYVKAGAYADALTETDPTDISRDPAHVSARLKLAAIAEAKAEEHLRREISLLYVQGRKDYYTQRYYYVYPTLGYCTSPPWTGTTVTTLTDVCLTHAPEPGPPPPPDPGGDSIPNGLSDLEAFLPVSQQALDNPNINLISMGGRWWELENTEGVFTLDDLISEIKRVVTFGKKILLRFGNSGGGSHFNDGNMADWVMDTIGADPGIWDTPTHKWIRYPGNFQFFGDATTTSGNPTVLSRRAYFTAADLHRPISGVGIPVPAYIGVINTAGGPGLLGSIGLSSSAVANVPLNATATGAGVDITIANRPKVAATNHDMVWGRTYDYTFRGTQTTIAVFWDPIYLAKKRRFLNEIGHQLFFTNRLTTAEKNAIKVCAVSFCAAATEDWNVPTHNDDTGHGQTQWAQWENPIDAATEGTRGMGYTTQLLADAAVKRADESFTTGQTFANKRLVCVDANFTHADVGKVVNIVGLVTGTEIKIASWTSKDEVMLNQVTTSTIDNVSFTIVARDTGLFDIVAAAFPGAVLTNAVAETLVIDEPAATLAGDDSPDDYMARLVHGILRTKYPERVLAQMNQVSNLIDPSPGIGTRFELLGKLKTAGSEIAGQTLWSASGDASYRMNGGSLVDPNTGETITVPEILKRALIKGKSYDMHFIEIYPKDIANATTDPEMLAAIEFAYTLLTTS